MFNSTKQEAKEPIGTYLARLRKVAATCKFGEMQDEMLRDQIMIGVSDNGIG